MIYLLVQKLGISTRTVSDKLKIMRRIEAAYTLVAAVKALFRTSCVPKVIAMFQGEQRWL